MNFFRWIKDLTIGRLTGRGSGAVLEFFTNFSTEIIVSAPYSGSPASTNL